LRLFIDEDLGSGIPEALLRVGVRDVIYPRPNGRPIAKGTPDEMWIPYCGEQGYLVISQNVAIARSPAQRHLLKCTVLAQSFSPPMGSAALM
jgi:hypothetical protein